MSLEELSLRDGLVVCPQCLTAYQAVEQGTLPPQVSRLEDSTTATHAKRFCPHCGEKIGQGINFCPYCGGNLRDDAASSPDDVVKTASSRETGIHDKEQVSQQGANKHRHGNPDKDDEPQQTFDWKPIIPSYRLAQIRRSEPASPRFQAFAIATILALLALLAFIVYHASLLNV